MAERPGWTVVNVEDWATTLRRVGACGGSSNYVPGYHGTLNQFEVYNNKTITVEGCLSTGVCGVRNSFWVNRERSVSCPVGTTYYGDGKSCVLYEGIVAPIKHTCSANDKGNPCNPATGNKYQHETDIAANSQPIGLSFERHYNTKGALECSFFGCQYVGAGWRHNYGSSLTAFSVVGTDTVVVRRGDGSMRHFAANGGAWSTDSDITDRLEPTAGGWRYLARDGTEEVYDDVINLEKSDSRYVRRDGRLVSVTDPAGRARRLDYYPGPAHAQRLLRSVTGPFGHQLNFGYDPAGRLITVTDSLDRTVRYQYGPSGDISRVDYPDGTAKLYHYENLGYLTGISYQAADGVPVRFSTYAYDTSGRAISTEHAGGMEKFSFTYDNASQTTVTDATNNKEVLIFTTRLSVSNLTTKINRSDNKVLNQTFDANNNLTCRQDEEGRVTTWAYNAYNQKLSETTGRTGSCSGPVTTAATRTTTYQYLSTGLDLPTLIESPSVATGQVKRVTIGYTGKLPAVITQSGFTSAGTPVSRTIALSYNSYGQVISINGPRTDVADITTLTYYECTTGGACGQLKSAANALGHTTTYDQYDAAGQLQRMTDPNGLVTTYQYDPRGRVRFITQGSRITEYRYDVFGNVAYAALPDGRVLTYTYDAANYLRTISDNTGSRIEYGYDLKGNRISEKTYDSSNTLTLAIDRAFDARDRVREINNGGSITKQVFDALGNLTSVTDPNTVATNGTTVTASGYDALNRLLSTVDKLSGTTQYGYDPNDRVKSVTAPNGAATGYEYDDLGNLLKETSPDRGTIVYSVDAAGNVVGSTDARGVSAAYSYDALNRLTQATYPASSGENVSYVYDSSPGCTAGLGRLCQVTDEAGVSAYGYDVYGNVRTHTRSELGGSYVTTYDYDTGNRVTAITYPDSRVAAYTRDVVGRVVSASLTVNGTTLPILTNRSYRPDGLITSQAFGNGLNDTRVYDVQGRLREQYLGSADTRLYGYDANGNLTSLQSLPQVGQYTYDALNRLAEDRITSTPNDVRSFRYDRNGNRLADGTVGSATPPIDFGLLGAYDFDGDLSDHSLFARNGSLVGTVSYVAGVSGQAVSLAGISNNYVDLGPMEDIEGSAAWTIAAWVRMRNLDTAWQHVLGKATYWASGDIGLHCNYAYCGAYVGAGYQAGTVPTNPLNGWHHWASVYDNGTLRFYLDGGLKSQINANGVPGVNNYTFKLGTANLGTRPAAADLDSLRIYRRALTNSDINQLMTTGAAPIPPPSGTPPVNTDNHIYASQSNRLTFSPQGAVTLDASGNTLASGTQSFEYNHAGRLATARIAGNPVASYLYNAQGLRARKTLGGTTTVYHYDLAGNLLLETSADGTAKVAYLWADGLPLAQVTRAGGTDALATLHTDHLNTPRLATDASQRVVWRFDGRAFGDTAPKQDPDGDGVTTTINLRFPGQYYDQETGLHYNWNRYYDPKLGRYITSDPAGLYYPEGLNTYAYAANNPLYWIDPTGLGNIHVLPPWIPTGNPTYPNWMIPTNDWGFPTGAYPGSTKPDPQQPNCRNKNCPEILPGTYPFTIAPFPRTPRPNRTPIPAPLLGNDGTVPTRAPNPNNGNQNSATGIRIHPGLPSQRQRTGSEGCLTLDPKFWDDFMNDIGSSGNVVVW